MTNELQKPDEQQQSSLPAVPQKLGLKLAYGAWAAVPSAIVLDVMSQGQLGTSAVIGGVLGITGYYFAEDIHRTLAPGLRAAGQVGNCPKTRIAFALKHAYLPRILHIGTKFPGKAAPHLYLSIGMV